MRIKKSLSFQEKLGRWVVYTRGGGFVWWSRVVYQNSILGGKKIPKGIIIHHKNQDPTDDRPENLEATVRKIHAPIHHEGTKHSEETKRKIGEGNSGKERSQETLKKLSESHTGKKRSLESIEKQRMSMKGRKQTPEHVEKVRQVHLGKKRSPETRKRISEAKKEYFQNKRNSE